MEKKLFIETYGCQMNVADSEVVAAVMRMAGYEVCQALDEADAVFLNTCSVRDNAEQKILSRLEYLRSLRRGGRGLIIGVLGCMAERVRDGLLQHGVDMVCGPDAYMSLPDLMAQVEAGHKAVNVELSTTETYGDVVPQRLHGSHIGGYVTKPARVTIIGENKNSTILEISISEGKNRQVRKMCKAVGNPVQELHRVSIGEIKLGRLKVGTYRKLNKAEIEYIKNC